MNNVSFTELPSICKYLHFWTYLLVFVAQKIQEIYPQQNCHQYLVNLSVFLVAQKRYYYCNNIVITFVDFLEICFLTPLVIFHCLYCQNWAWNTEYYIFSRYTAHKWTSGIFLDFVTSTFHLHKNQTQNHSLSQILHYKYSLLSISNLLMLQSGLLFSINRLCYETNWSPCFTETTEMVKYKYFQRGSITLIAEHRSKLMLLSAHIVPDYRMTAHRNWQQRFIPEKLPFFVLFTFLYFSLWFFFAVSRDFKSNFNSRYIKIHPPSQIHLPMKHVGYNIQITLNSEWMKYSVQ